ncbi:MAG: glycosyltransferase family 9 protein [Anaerolineae bacterium]|nr:glycosyltransferase family 9 protein [Anaerolineae bacterium]
MTTDPPSPRRMLLLKPCCIGDVIMATALLAALRRAYPAAHITWGVGTYSARAIVDHPLLDDLLPTGPAANPARSLRGLWRLARQMRAGHFDLAVVPVRSPLIGLAVWLAGVPIRAGLDSAGRGVFYSVRAPVDPAEPRHEAEIYLDVARALGLDTSDCWANVPVDPARGDRLPVPAEARGGLVVVHVGGGQNPGMAMAEKRPPLPLLADVAGRAAALTGGRIAILGGPLDGARAEALHEALAGQSPLILVNALDFGGIAALGAAARLVIGPDTGLVHLMAAAGAPTVMIFGPSDPRRYAPFVPPGRAAAPWRPFAMPAGGVSGGVPEGWNWDEHGVSADEVWDQIRTLL